ncbi:MAG: IS607 family transposase [Candidatus Thorarchaeota archaeon]|nr:IS607 family transposase [Candidatus Thorarchaeota archaeon]
MYSVSQAALRLGVCVRTIHRWDKTGKLRCFRTVGGHRRIPLAEVNRLLGLMHRDLIQQPSKKRCAIYARVSSHRQKTAGDLDRQLKLLTKECRKRFKTSPLVFSDIGSGLNMRRRGLSRLFSLAKSGSIHTLIITHRDRLTRFGLELLERILNDYGVRLEVLYQPEQQSPQEELVTDLMSLIASFSGRVYELRAHQSKRINLPQRT